jgi:hypothetical protein
LTLGAAEPALYSEGQDYIFLSGDFAFVFNAISPAEKKNMKKLNNINRFLCRRYPEFIIILRLRIKKSIGFLIKREALREKGQSMNLGEKRVSP